MRADAGRELATGGQHVLETQAVALNAEGRDRVATGVHGDQLLVLGDIDQRAL